MNEKRRLKIAKRQLALAQIGRREARYSLAKAIAEEERSAQIHVRAQKLLDAYAKRAVDPEVTSQSGALQANLAFVRSLQTMAEGAGEAYKDARDQAEYQIAALAAAETRMDAHVTRVGEEKRALDELRLRREIPPELTGLKGGQTGGGAGMARKLQTREQTGDEAAAKGNR